MVAVGCDARWLAFKFILWLPWCDFANINDTSVSSLYLRSKREVIIIPHIIVDRIKREISFLLVLLPRAG